jgi:hypothetical protein
MFKPARFNGLFPLNIDGYKVSSKVISHGAKCVNRIYEEFMKTRMDELEGAI